MRKVRAGLVMTLVAGLLLTSGSRAQAVIGVPDDVPAATLLFPFFKVNPKRTAASQQDSLLVVTNTGGAVSSSAPDRWVHFTISNVKSEHVFDFSVKLTPHDVWSCSLYDLLASPTPGTNPCPQVAPAPTGVVDALMIKVGTADILAGYVTVDAVSGPTSIFPGQAGYPFADANVLIGHLYLVDLPAGSATGFSAVSVEAGSTLLGSPFAATTGHPAELRDRSQIGFYLTRCLEEQAPGDACLPFPTGTYGNRERIDGFSGDFAQTGTATPPAGNAAGDSPLSLLVRYFSATNLVGKTEIWLWKDRVTPGKRVNLSVFDEEENVHSVTFKLDDEVNFTETNAIITPGAPGGWFRIKFECAPFGYCGYDAIDPTTALTSGGALTTPIQAVAYSLQFAQSSNATLRWDAAFPAHRQYTNYSGVSE